MDKQTTEALEGSIKKWEAIVAGEGADAGIDNCPLCTLFYAHECEGCPVNDKTGKNCCDGSPYQRWSEYLLGLKQSNPLVAVDDESRKLARAELDFLKALRS